MQMALIVIAGMSSCAKYAQAEFIAGILSNKLPHFKVRRIVIEEENWDTWALDKCKRHEWNHTKCPVVWRELAMPGGKPVLIGGLSDFLEFCHEYYGLTAFLTPEEKQMLVDDNMKIKKNEKKKAKSQYKVQKILISGAPTRILPILISDLLNLQCVGREDDAVIYLFDKSTKKYIFEQIQKDSALMGANSGMDASKIVNTLQEGLADCDIFIILNAFTRPSETNINEIFKKNYAAMLKLAKVIDEHAPPTCRVIMAGAEDAPVCFNATVLASASQNLQPQNLVVVTTHIGMEAMPTMTKLTETKLCDLACPAVWGFIGLNQYIDFDNMIYKATYFVPNKRALKRIPNSTLPQGRLITELRKFNYLMENIQHLWKYIKKYKTYLQNSSESSELPRVEAIVTLIKLWFSDDYEGEVISLGVNSDGTFGIPPGLFFSQPVFLENGNWIPYGKYPRPHYTKCNLDDFINTALYVLMEYARDSLTQFSTVWKYVDSEELKAQEKYEREARYRYPEYPNPQREMQEHRRRNEVGVAKAMIKTEFKWKLDGEVDFLPVISALEERYNLRQSSSITMRMSFHSVESLQRREMELMNKIAAERDVKEILVDIIETNVIKSEEIEETKVEENENKE